jgi:GNAT superfamily N-acetyltransferase
LSKDPLSETRARTLWINLAHGPADFRESELDVIASPDSQLCPPGWVGIVTLGNSAIATAPEPDRVRSALDGLPIAALTDPEAVGERLPISDVLGPATLAYCDVPPPGEPVEQLPREDLAELIEAVTPEEAGEAALEDLTSAAFVVRDAGRVVAAAGYELWPYGVAHLSVLTAPDHRGRGLARTVAGAAVRDAMANDLLPQWRARPAASRRVAAALGFRELGKQLSIQLNALT